MLSYVIKIFRVVLVQYSAAPVPRGDLVGLQAGERLASVDQEWYHNACPNFGWNRAVLGAGHGREDED